MKDPRDQVAWQEFYDLYRPLIHRYCRQCGLAVTDAEEIVAVCLHDLVNQFARFRYEASKGKFKSWLRKLVYHKVFHLLRDRRTELVSPSQMARTPDVAQEQDPAWEKIWQSEVLNYCVQQAKMQVSEEDYRVFQLAVIDGWPVSKIVEVCRLTPDQVYRIKYNVLQVIRAHARPYFEDEQ